MMNEGWVKLHRSLLTHPLWTRERFTRGQAWADLLMLASYADHDVVMGSKIVSVKAGEILTSKVKLAAKWKWDRETVSRFFQSLERLTMLHIRTSRESETGYTLITLVNWPLYQGSDTPPLALIPPSDATSDATSYPTSVPHPCHTLKKGKKGKKQKKSGETPPLPADLEQVRTDLRVLRLSPETLHRYLVTYNGKLDLAFELRKADGWCQDHPTRAPRSDYAKFMTRWLNNTPPPRTDLPHQVGPALRDEDVFLDGCWKSPETAAKYGEEYRACAKHRGVA